jgi:RecJ-like exonuclease
MEFELLVKDGITGKLKPLILAAAEKLLEAEKSSRFTLLRYHNDADGISGALALASFIGSKSMQQNSAIYSEKDANYDLEACAGHSNPLLVLVDFGASEESIRALNLLKAAGVEIIIIDHHAPAEAVEKIASLFVSPWSVSSDEKCSQYPAGYICAEIARCAGKDAEELAKISCAGDKSAILETKQEHRDRATVLDYLALFHKRGNLAIYLDVISDPYLLKSTLFEAREKMGAIVQSLVKSAVCKKTGKFEIFLVNMEHMFEKYDFPSRGKIITVVSEELENKNPDRAVVVVGYGQRAVMVRTNEKALSSGCNAKEIMEKLKVSMKDFVENAGGHPKAAAARVTLGFAKSVAEEIIKIMEGKQVTP